MKKFLLACLTCMVAGLVFVSCSKSDDEMDYKEPTAQEENGKFDFPIEDLYGTWEVVEYQEEAFVDVKEPEEGYGSYIKFTEDRKVYAHSEPFYVLQTHGNGSTYNIKGKTITSNFGMGGVTLSIKIEFLSFSKDECKFKSQETIAGGGMTKRYDYIVKCKKVKKSAN